MITLSLKQNINIIKRHMETSTQSKRKRVIQDNSENEIKTTIPPEISPDSSSHTIPEFTIPVKEYSWRESLYARLSPADQQALTKEKESLHSEGNLTTAALPEYAPLYLAPNISIETFLTNAAYRTFVANVETVSEKLNIEITKSTELAHEWKTHIYALDTYIKSLVGLSWKKTLTYSACIFAILTFLWKMGAYRMIPNFASNILATNIPGAGKSFVQSTDLPAPNIKATINAIMETPLTPIGVVFGVGTISIGFGILHTIAFILRKLPK